MKRSEFKTLKEKTHDELAQMVRIKQLEISKARMEFLVGKVKNVRLVKNLRHGLARVKTLMREKEREEQE
ncbi:MAG: 50S ribosomal protein L29 [Candidatus Blackburnbacteria bacterium]|nr:50S ribosomal protein L29 [Candidatus Blackburnbacteria bacterium]